MPKSHLKLVTPAIIKRTVTPRRLPNADLRTREHLTEGEVDRLTVAARKNRWGHRDATMILMAYRHGFRAAELVDLQWHQIEFASATLHVRRVKQGTPAPIRFSATNCALCVASSASRNPSHPSCSPRSAGSPFTAAGFARMVERAGDRGEARVQGPPAHAPARLRLRAGQQGARHSRSAGLPRPQEYPAHGALHGVVADAVQGFLALISPANH